MCTTVMVNTPEIDPTFLSDDLYRRLAANVLQTPEAIDMPYITLQTPNVTTQQSSVHPLSIITTATSYSDLLDLSQRSTGQQTPVITSNQFPTLSTLSTPSGVSSTFPYVTSQNIRGAPLAHFTSYTPTTPDVLQTMFRTPSLESMTYGRGTGGVVRKTSTASSTYTPSASATQSASTPASFSSDSIDSIIEIKPETPYQSPFPAERRHSLYGINSYTAQSSPSTSALYFTPSESCPPRFCYMNTGSVVSSTVTTSSMGISTMTTSSTQSPTLLSSSYMPSGVIQSLQDTYNTHSQPPPSYALTSRGSTATASTSFDGLSSVEELDRFLNERKYLEFRHKNNMASKKFRTTKRSKQKQMDEQIKYYIDDNKKCIETIARMEKEIEFCKQILFKNFRKSDSQQK